MTAALGNVWVVSSTPQPHFTPGKDPVPILQEAGWTPRPVWTDGKSRPHRDSIPDRPARSQSLYLLSYPTHVYHSTCFNKTFIVNWGEIGNAVVAAGQDVLRRMVGETVYRWDDVVFVKEYTPGNCDHVWRDLDVGELNTSNRYPTHASLFN